MPTPTTGLDVTLPKGFWTQPLTADQRASAQLKHKVGTGLSTSPHAPDLGLSCKLTTYRQAQNRRSVTRVTKPALNDAHR